MAGTAAHLGDQIGSAGDHHAIAVPVSAHNVHVLLLLLFPFSSPCIASYCYGRYLLLDTIDSIFVMVMKKMWVIAIACTVVFS